MPHPADLFRFWGLGKPTLPVSRPAEAGGARPIVNPARHCQVVTPQKLERKLLGAIRTGADTPRKILGNPELRDFEAADLRLAFERLRDAGKIAVTARGTVAYTAGKRCCWRDHDGDGDCDRHPVQKAA